jgi:hypothetical protein
MTLQILEILLYSRQGEVRRLPFRLGALNVITGGSGTGKVEQAIKDTLPYFLGAVPEDQLKLQQELREKRRRLSQWERRLEEAEAVRGANVSRAAGLLREAQAVGLLGAGDLPSDVNGMAEVLRSIRFAAADQQ